MVKGIKRLIPVLCCIVILISCMVVPASALGPSVDPGDPGTKLYPLINGSVFYTCSSSYDNETRSGTSVGLCDVTWNSNTEFLATYSSIDSQFLPPSSGSAVGPGEWRMAQYVRCSTVETESYTNFRIYERYKLVSADGSVSPLFPWSATFSIDDFGGLWNKDMIRSLFYVHGRYSFVVNFSAYSIQDNKLLSTRKTYNGSANGAQSVLYGSWMNSLEEELQLSPGDPFFFADFTIQIPWGIEGQDLQISRLSSQCGIFSSESSADPTSVYIDYPINRGRWGESVSRYSLNTFLTTNGLITGPGQSYIEGGDITQFLAGSASSVLDAPLFGGMTLGGILAVILSVAIVFWLLKFFAGG